MANVVEHPDEPKYRAVPADNRRVHERILQRKGGRSFLVAAGWRLRVQDMREFWTAPDSLNDLRVARDVLRERLDRIDEKLQAERERHERQKEADAARAAVALQQYEDDRRTWQTRHELTGGTKASVAQPFRAREDETLAPAPPAPQEGHVLGEDEADV